MDDQDIQKASGEVNADEGGASTTIRKMYEAAKEVNAFWFSQQALELAILFKEKENVDFAKADARQFVGRQLSSGSGFQAVHQWLTQNGKLGQAPQGGGSCGVK